MVIPGATFIPESRVLTHVSNAKRKIPNVPKSAYEPNHHSVQYQ